jgi:hypothetical protein
MHPHTQRRITKRQTQHSRAQVHDSAGCGGGCAWSLSSPGGSPLLLPLEAKMRLFGALLLWLPTCATFHAALLAATHVTLFTGSMDSAERVPRSAEEDRRRREVLRRSGQAKVCYCVLLARLLCRLVVWLSGRPRGIEDHATGLRVVVVAPPLSASLSDTAAGFDCASSQLKCARRWLMLPTAAVNDRDVGV